MPKLSQPRSLKPEERLLIEFLLSADFPERDDLKQQMDRVEVIEECDCGCGTADLRIKEVGTDAIGCEQIVVEAYGNDVDVLLFVRSGLLSSLEIVDHGDSRPLSYPTPSNLKLWVPPRRK